jgi:hypothetical protein
MTPSPTWFALQLTFAERAAALTELPFEEALLRFTNVYRRAGLGQSRDPEQPNWQGYLRGLRAAADQAAWTADFCRAHAQPASGAFCGCFHYDYFPETRKIRLHFANNDDSGAGPLSRGRLSIRRAELGALFAAIARACPDALSVRGVSWLHGIAAYRRLYPPEYAQSARPLTVEQVLPSMPLWGQFLDHTGRVKDDLATTFLSCVARAGTFSDLVACFPQQVYEVECDIAHFYRFYGVPPPVVSVP